MSQHATYVGGKWYSQWIIDIEQKNGGINFRVSWLCLILVVQSNIFRSFPFASN